MGRRPCYKCTLCPASGLSGIGALIKPSRAPAPCRIIQCQLENKPRSVRSLAAVAGQVHAAYVQKPIPRSQAGTQAAQTRRTPARRGRRPAAQNIAKRGFLLSRGREDFSTQSRICLGSRARTWQIANHKRRRGGVGTLLLSWVWDSWCKIFVSRRGGLALESGPRASFGKKHEFKFL